MVLFAGAEDFKTSLYDTFTALCEDPHHVVRKTVASGFHEVSTCHTWTELMANNRKIKGKFFHMLQYVITRYSI